MPEATFEGKTIWITRPEGQGDNLSALLAREGAQVRLLPMLAIDPLPEDAAIRTKVLALDTYDLLFFISTNAATLGMTLIDRYWPQFPVALAIYSVGPTTAAVIEKYDLAVEYPQQRMSSEALLALPSLADIDGKKALIVRGVGGRELLAEQLASRGAGVDYLELYRRVCPAYSKGTFASLVAAGPPAGVVITSAEAITNLKTLLDADQVDTSTLPLYVSSPRLAVLAAASGFVQTITMPAADDKAIIETLKAIS